MVVTPGSYRRRRLQADDVLAALALYIDGWWSPNLILVVCVNPR
jgi:hypothetical protein